MDGGTQRKYLMGIGHFASYDALSRELDLERPGGTVVARFYGVPEAVWYEWRRAPDKAAYFNARIKSWYSCKLE